MKQFILLIFLTVTSCGATPLVPLPIDESQPQNSPDYKLIRVESSTQLKKALAEARPGDSIVVAPGKYEGRFILSKSGTETQPIVVEGTGTTTILDAGDTNTGYVFHLQGNHCKIKKMTLQNGLKGFMADNASFNTLAYLTVKNIGAEAIHLLKFSSHNVVQSCNVSDTGLKRPRYGERLYIATATSNTAKHSDREPGQCEYITVIY